MTHRFQKTVDIKTVNEDERTATGAVLVPNELDHQEDFFRPDAVERFHADNPDTGVMHSAFPEDAAELTRHEVLESPEEIGDETFPAGTEVATRKYHDDDLWQLVEDGVLQGFSIGGEISRAVDHDELPDNVRVPDSVDHEQGGTELISGTVEEISDVDIPAVPRATYKSDIGKAILDEVDGKAEFVELMVEQRGHEEGDAKQLYDYLTSVRGKSRQDILANGNLGKPFESPDGAQFESFDDCLDTLMNESDMNREEAEEVCGAWQDESKNKVEVNGTEVDLTPPEAVVNAAEAALEAKRDTYADDLGDCGSGVGESRAESIIANDLEPEDFVGGENTAIPDYLDSHSEDVEGISQPPTDWGEETWTDGCGPVQYALWGGTATGTGLEWANETERQLSEAMDQENMTDKTDEPDDATKWRKFKSWLSGTDDTSGVEEAGKASDEDGDDDADDEEEDEDEGEGEDDEMENNAPGGDTSDKSMTEDTDTSDPPEWAKSLTEQVEQNAEKIDDLAARQKTVELEVDGEPVELTEKELREALGEDTEKSITDDAPEWAKSVVDTVEENSQRIEQIGKQSGMSHQLDATKQAENGEDKVETFKSGLVPTGGR